jgi:hypothetical protein
MAIVQPGAVGKNSRASTAVKAAPTMGLNGTRTPKSAAPKQTSSHAAAVGGGSAAATTIGVASAGSATTNACGRPEELAAPDDAAGRGGEARRRGFALSFMTCGRSAASTTSATAASFSGVMTLTNLSAFVGWRNRNKTCILSSDTSP